MVLHQKLTIMKHQYTLNDLENINVYNHQSIAGSPTPLYLNQHINKLYDDGNEIVYWTARGGHSGIDWSSLSRSQLDKWGCKYNRLEWELKKPSWDLLIDDKTKRIEEI